MSKLEQLRALREARFSSCGASKDAVSIPALIRPSGARSGDSTAPVGEIMEPSGVKLPPREAKFDRVAYQREYMRKRRAQLKQKRNANSTAV